MARSDVTLVSPNTVCLGHADALVCIPQPPGPDDSASGYVLTKSGDRHTRFELVRGGRQIKVVEHYDDFDALPLDMVRVRRGDKKLASVRIERITRLIRESAERSSAQLTH